MQELWIVKYHNVPDLDEGIALEHSYRAFKLAGISQIASDCNLKSYNQQLLSKAFLLPSLNITCQMIQKTKKSF